ncbi:hypothetical protein P280DRAFT_466405 [Massarina eburnea CBS 473.64]|uniref:Uncharacterized protein n=1 Tax=Massarina eburnea CBS 473.64 TaxID=1395130 RepID=A0A6A6S7K4_9PLEO|nr:hypothetical protein P280DRAFT_466405 [Massarina eburnea CBS 473.64]
MRSTTLYIPLNILAFLPLISTLALQNAARTEHAVFVDPGGPCAERSDCYGGAYCCSGICKLGSCRMDGTCDADNDCYGWCHNTPGKCSIKIGKLEGLCWCPNPPTL